jgi:serine/threonine protein kinase
MSSGVLPKPEDYDKTRALGPNAAAASSNAAVDPDALKPGTVAGAYVLKAELASGGGGTVYEAQHKILGRKVAVKILRRQLAASPQMVARFVQEARAVNLIKHPNIVDVSDFGELPDGRPFHVMELLEGTDLRTILNERGRFPAAEVLEILEPVCSALQAAHDHGIVHRDLKASNIFITSGPERRVKLLDFGIAKLMHPDAGEAGLTVVGTRLGTSYTMAPEQIRGEAIDPRTDIYALGVVLYHLLTGQYPFRAETMTEIERQHLEAPPPRPSQMAPLSQAIDAVVLRCMEKTADRRFPSVKAFIDALRDAAGPKSAASAESAAQAVAVYVDIRIADGDAAESDEVLDDTSAILDATEQGLRNAHLTLPLQTGNAILGARVLAPDAGKAAIERNAVVALARSLASELAQRPTAQPAVHVNVSVHVAPAMVKESADVPGGKEIVGGAIMSTADWAPADNVDGVHLSDAAKSS